MFCQLCVGPACVACSVSKLLNLMKRLESDPAFSASTPICLPLFLSSSSCSNPLIWKELESISLEAERLLQGVRNKGVLAVPLAP